MRQWLQRWTSLFKPVSSEPENGGRSLAEEAGTFLDWARRTLPGGDSTGIAFLDHALSSDKLPADPPEHLISNAAAALGMEWRQRLGGEWAPDPLAGLVLRAPRGLDACSLVPLAAVERKLRQRGRFSLAELTESLERRLDAEAGRTPWPGVVGAQFCQSLKGLTGTPAQEAAHQFAEDFRDKWKESVGASLPFSLVGVREVDRYLRTQYYVRFMSEGNLALAGFFVGEVARGLFSGAWNFENLPAIEDAALRWPEIDYHPVGRIYKMMSTWPDGEALDEYVRLVPSARAELRGGNPAV
jgi:hypothetical protein